MLGNTHRVGCGGKHCSCCYPPPSDYKDMNRSRKRSEKQQWKKEVENGEV